MPSPILAAVGGGLGSAVVGASSANKAAKAQKASADEQIALQREIYEDTSGKFAPYLSGGTNALGAYLHELGLGAAPMIGATAPAITEITTPGTTTTAAPGYSFDDRTGRMTAGQPQTTTTPGTTQYSVGGQTFGTREEAQAWADANKTGGTPYGGFAKTPGYDFRMGEGLNALRAGQAGQSGLVSGRTMRDLMAYGQDYATSEYDKYLARLAGLADMGSGAAANQGNAGANYSAQASNALAGAGNAASAGAVGVGNAFSDGINNGFGIYGYMKGLGGSGNNALAPATSLIPRARPVL